MVESDSSAARARPGLFGLGSGHGTPTMPAYHVPSSAAMKSSPGGYSSSNRLPGAKRAESFTAIARARRSSAPYVSVISSVSPSRKKRYARRAGCAAAGLRRRDTQLSDASSFNDHSHPDFCHVCAQDVTRPSRTAVAVLLTSEAARAGLTTGPFPQGFVGRIGGEARLRA